MEVERKREDMIKKARQLQMKTQNRRNQGNEAAEQALVGCSRELEMDFQLFILSLFVSFLVI